MSTLPIAKFIGAIISFMLIAAAITLMAFATRSAVERRPDKYLHYHTLYLFMMVVLLILTWVYKGTYLFNLLFS